MTEQPPDFSELAVPGEAGVWWCPRHRKVQTRLRCGRCEKPICPKCTRMGPTGARCLECASNRSQHIYQASPQNYAATFAAALVFSVLGAAIVPAAGIFLIFVLPLLVPFFGKAVTAVTGGKRGAGLAAVATAGALLGAGTPLALKWLSFKTTAEFLPAEYGATLGSGLMTETAFVLLFLAVLIPSLWHWIK
jgi:hypothetical protein